MAINIINATLQMRHGLEQDFDSDQMTVGEWAISTDSKYVRMCFLPGIVIRMATYEGFEKDMIEIQKILKECQDIKLAVETMADLAEQHKNDSASSALLSESWAHGNTGVRVGESTNNSEYYSNQSKNEADRAKNEADRAASIVGIDIDSELSEISTNPVQNKVVTKHLENKVSIDGDSSSTTVTFEAATQRAGIESGDSLAVAFGKLAKFCSDLDPHAFNPLANNLTTNTSGYGMDARQGPVIDKRINELNTNLANKVSSKSSATLSGLSIDAAQYPTFNFKVDGILKSAIFEYGASLTLRQYNADGTYSEVGVPVLINMKNSVASHGTSISNLESNALLYKGDVTNGLTETVASGIYTYDAANCANVPVTTGCGTIVSFGFGTTLCYRLCLTSASGVYYSVYIPGTTYGTWTKL